MGSREKATGGIEILLMNVIAEKLDMMANYTVVDDATAFSTITDDEETGFYSDLIKRKVDIMIGGLYDNKVSRRLLSTTIPYDSDEMTWCVQRAGLRPNWMNVFAIFDIMLWIYAIVCIFICAIILSYFVEIGREHSGNYFWALMITTCQSIGIYAHYDARRGFIRFYVGFMLLYGLNFNAAYQSFLLSVLTTPSFDHQVSTIQEAMDHNFKNFTGGENLRAYFREKDDIISKHLDVTYQPCYNYDQCLEKLKNDDKLAVAISRQHAMNAKISLTEDDMFCFEKANNIFSYSVVMLFKRDRT
jgi:hypothetical protein